MNNAAAARAKEKKMKGFVVYGYARRMVVSGLYGMVLVKCELRLIPSVIYTLCTC